MYNISKVARSSVLRYFNQIFDGLTKVSLTRITNCTWALIRHDHLYNINKIYFRIINCLCNYLHVYAIVICSYGHRCQERCQPTR